MDKPTSPAPAPTRKRVRDPEAHRAAILNAARATFTEYGYARATIREIARRAGVTHGLVMRHFQSKENLFIAAVPGARDVEQLVQGDPDTLPARIAQGYVARMEEGAAGDPFVALIRSAASNEETAVRLYNAMHERSMAGYLKAVTAPDAEIRIELLAAELIGVTFSRYVIRRGPLLELSPDQLSGHLARVIRAILTD
ncbi:TetR family transcriptional regulator [Streptomyces sp. NPDC088387]|uniref:TetR/AcrR family transcriptional regulator n=1 Tax=Streptomyces sp. NPDC088387 TaxID=3365859 RepID=UPI003803F5CB